MKILCPNHADKTPSLHLYPTRAFCFVCRYSCPIEEVADAETRKQIKKEPENIVETVRYIQSLPTEKIRGLYLHADTPSSFYVLWPDGSYYKLRITTGKSRYLGPRGRRAPLFLLLPPRPSNTLVVVEGELNALSLAEVFPERSFTIASPGAASEFQRHAKEYTSYAMVYSILDRDPAGIANGVILKEYLTRIGIRNTLILVDTDYNDLLQQSPAVLKAAFTKETGLE